MRGLVKDLLPPVIPDTRPLKRWGLVGEWLSIIVLAPAAPTSPGQWEELGPGAALGDLRVNGAWVAPDKTATYWRNWRDAELAASDWIVTRATETGDPVPQPWLDYRQALRDIPEQPGFPGSVVWPTKPEG